MKRGFEIVSSYEGQGLHLPQRQTKAAAGYDFEAARDFTLPSIWKMDFIKVLWAVRHQEEVSRAATIGPSGFKTLLSAHGN